MAKVIVIGAGPAGIMASLSASKNNEVTLIERNSEIGKKLKPVSYTHLTLPTRCLV